MRWTVRVLQPSWRAITLGENPFSSNASGLNAPILIKALHTPPPRLSTICFPELRRHSRDDIVTQAFLLQADALLAAHRLRFARNSVLFLYKLYKPYFTELSEQFSKLYEMTV